MDIATAAPLAEAKAPTAKPVLTLSAKAVEQIREVMKQQGYEGYTLTVRVVPAGC